MTDQITANTGEWTSRHGTKPSVLLYRHMRNGRRILLAPVDFRQARELADQLHDACDEHEARHRHTAGGAS